MNNLSHVRFDHGRIISDSSPYDPEINPGIRTHNKIGKFFADCFGSGTVKVYINNEKCYLNRNSCLKFFEINGLPNCDVDETEKIILNTVNIFNKIHNKKAGIIPDVADNLLESWNRMYSTSDQYNQRDDPIFNLISSVSANEFTEVHEAWLNLPWVKNLDPIIQENFEKFLNNISNFSIDRQMEVFSNEDVKEKAYAFFKQGIVYLYNQVKDDSESGTATILQLTLALGECPASYLSFIRTAIHAVADKAIAKDNTCQEQFNHFYDLYRRKTAEKMAAHFGRQETHTLNSILHLIGEERKIPGYLFVISDKQMDVRANQHSQILHHFDEQNSPEHLINWFYKKIHGEFGDKSGLFNEIQKFLTAEFQIDTYEYQHIIFDIDEDDTIRFKPKIVAICLEHFGMIQPKDPEQSEKLKFQEEIQNQ